MRRICYNVAASLDGFIAGPHGDYDWIPMDPEVDFAALYARFDTVLMGRRSFEALGEARGLLAGKRLVVASRTLPAATPGVTVVGDPVAGARALRAEDGLDVWLWGGGELFRTLLGAGLVDTVEVSVVPVLLGGGIPLLPPPSARATLVLTSHRLYPQSGIVTLSYAASAEGAASDAVS